MEQIFTFVVGFFAILCFILAAVLLVFLAVFIIRFMIEDFWK